MCDTQLFDDDDSSDFDSSDCDSSDDDLSDDELFEKNWFHGSKPTKQIEKLLRNDGDFLVHTSKDRSSKATVFMLAVFWEHLQDFQIRRNRTGWTVEGKTYPSIPTLIDNLKGKYVTNESKIILKKPVIKEEWKLKKSDIVLEKKIGWGNFGEVHLGFYRPKEMKVAVKISNKSMSEDETNKFVREGVTLAKLSHPNIVGLIGIVDIKKPMIVMEYVSGGDLQNKLKQQKRENKYLPNKTLIRMCKDAACGMAYLEKKSVIHRDLAARNCLVDNLRVKITDFGMSREEDVYMSESKNFPVRWTAPESLTNNVYTSKSDVWSFGILMWEIFSEGDLPYPNIRNEDVVSEVKRGYTMSAPTKTPEGCYYLMYNCWEMNPDDRYSFGRIKRELKVIHENM